MFENFDIEIQFFKKTIITKKWNIFLKKHLTHCFFLFLIQCLTFWQKKGITLFDEV